MKLLSNDELIENGIISQADSELYHYGVVGMKWGVRRYQPYSVAPRGSGKGGVFKPIGSAAKTVGAGIVKIGKATKGAVEALSEAQKEAKKKQVIRSKSMQALADNMDLFDDNELRSIKSRLDLEYQVRDSAKRQKDAEIRERMAKIETGKRVVIGVIKGVKTVKALVDKAHKLQKEREKKFIERDRKELISGGDWSALYTRLDELWDPSDYESLAKQMRNREKLKIAAETGKMPSDKGGGGGGKP